MTDAASAPEGSAPPAAPELSEDQRSGAKFVRWNALSALLGLGLLTAGLAAGDPPQEAVRAATPTGALLRDAAWDDGMVEVATYTDAATSVRVLRARALDPDRFELVQEQPGTAQVRCLVARRDPGRLLLVEAARLGDAGPERPALRRSAGGLRREPPLPGLGPLPGSAWSEDQLPLLARVLADASEPLELWLAPSLLAAPGPAVPARLIVAGGEQRPTEAGPQPCHRVEVQAGERSWRFWVGDGPGRPLLAWEDGARTFELRGLGREPWPGR